MKQRFSIILLILFCKLVGAQAPKLEWVRQVGGSQYQFISDQVTDNDGNMYYSGGFNGLTDLDPGTGISQVIAAGNISIFISKIDSSGNLIWGKQLGTFGSYQAGRFVELDYSGNLYVAGYCYDVMDADPGQAVFNITPGIFLIKLDSAGNFIWARSYSDGDCTSLKLCNDSSLILTGEFYGTLSVIGTQSVSAYGFRDGFIVKTSTAGIDQWAKRIGGPNGGDLISGSAVDSSGNIYISGNCQDSVSFGNTATYNFKVGGLVDGFICKLSNNGNFIWVKQIASDSLSSALGSCISSDNNGNVFVGGYFNGNVDFNPGIGIYNRKSIDDYDSFLLKLDSLGNFINMKTFEGLGNQYMKSICSDLQSNIYVTGIYFNTIYYNSSTGPSLSGYVAGQDIFVFKLNPSLNLKWGYSIGVSSAVNESGSITINNDQSIVVTGNFGKTIDFDPDTGIYNLTSVLGTNGRDAFLQKINQVSCNATTSNVNIVQCNSFASPSGNNVWSLSGVYVDTIPNSRFCDSIITFNLVINHTYSSISVSDCNNFTSPSGNYIWNQSGTYLDTIPSSFGCDSIITVNLLIYSMNDSVILVQGSLYALDSVASYQWIDCNTLQPVSGANSQAFVPGSGSFAVVLTNGSCIDTSNCLNITGDNNYNLNRLGFYPNPVNKEIKFSIELQNFSVIIADETGRIVFNKSFGKLSELNVENLAPGFYTLLLNSDGNSNVFKILKE